MDDANENLCRAANEEESKKVIQSSMSFRIRGDHRCTQGPPSLTRPCPLANKVCELVREASQNRIYCSLFLRFIGCAGTRRPLSLMILLESEPAEKPDCYGVGPAEHFGFGRLEGLAAHELGQASVRLFGRRTASAIGGGPCRWRRRYPRSGHDRPRIPRLLAVGRPPVSARGSSSPVTPSAGHAPCPRPPFAGASAHGSTKVQNCPPTPTMRFEIANDSKVEPASRSILVTTSIAGSTELEKPPQILALRGLQRAVVCPTVETRA